MEDTPGLRGSICRALTWGSAVAGTGKGQPSEDSTESEPVCCHSNRGLEEDMGGAVPRPLVSFVRN